MRVLVTGAGGFLPSHLCDGLVERGYEVIGLFHTSQKRIKHLKNNKNFQAIKGDITNYDEILESLKANPVDGIFHTAALHTPKEISSPFPYFEPNVRGTLDLLEACHSQNIKRVIYTSSMGVYGRAPKYLPVDEKHPVSPFDFYSLTKLQGEMLCELYASKYGFNVIILRCSGIFGPRREWGGVANFVKGAIQNKPPIVLSDIKWDTIYVKDAVSAHISAFENIDKFQFEVFNIGRGEEISTLDLANLIVSISASTAKPEFSGDSRPFRFYFDITKARELLNFAPCPIEESLTEYIKLEARSENSKR
ncbi:MAG: NAD-dependent epimerase/dehydratase family protein [Dehalococcoidales bacterium]|nr:NAD-dependent epimerase/dehydratase family protein [Dehalococcoidales bacterium]